MKYILLLGFSLLLFVADLFFKTEWLLQAALLTMVALLISAIIDLVKYREATR